MKTTGTFQGLTALGWLGIAGGQHFYLGKPGKGLIWFFTMGLFMFGTIYDHLTAGMQVGAANRTLGHAPFPMVAYAPPLPMPAPQPQPIVVNVGASDGTSATAEQIKAIAGGGLADALRELNKLRYDRLIDDQEFDAMKAKLLKDYA